MDDGPWFQYARNKARFTFNYLCGRLIMLWDYLIRSLLTLMGWADKKVEICLLLLYLLKTCFKWTQNFKRQLRISNCDVLLSKWLISMEICLKGTAQKMKFSIKDFFSKCDQIRRKLFWQDNSRITHVFYYFSGIGYYT